MTDNEIIKAKELIKKLEEAYNAYYDTSKGMPYDIDKTLRESAICIENALAEINRQKAEIERLEDVVKRLQHHSRQLCMLEKAQINRIKAEAVKEFAERLKEKQHKEWLYDEAGFSAHIPIIEAEVIDRLVKELTGEQT